MPVRRAPGPPWECTRLLLVVVCAALWAASAFAADAPWERRIRVTEPTDYGRTAWPILVRLDSPQPEEAVHQVRVYRRGTNGADTVVPSQVMRLADPEAVLSGMSNGTMELCFAADLLPRSSATFVVKVGGANAAPPANRLVYEGGGFGIKVDTGAALFAFDPLSGQLGTYRPKLAGVDQDIYFRQVAGRRQPCHWNPDVWVEGKSWGHVSDWNCERPETRPESTIVRGDLAFRMVRSGRMWSSDTVHATVSYTAFAGMPFLLESSEMKFTAPTSVRAIRHNELVFSRGLHTHAVWPDGTGSPQIKPIYNKPDPKQFLGLVQSVSADIPWLGLLNDERRYGIGIVNFFRRESTVDGSSPRNENVRYYFLDYGEHGTGESYDNNFAYVCRPLYYDEEKQAPVQVAAGTTYEERSAFLVFGLGAEDSEQRYEGLLGWVRLLREPPVVVVEPP